MKPQRNLSGIYFRERTTNGDYEPVVFEDLSDERQDEVMNNRDIEWVKGLAKKLAKTINKIGDQFDIVAP